MKISELEQMTKQELIDIIVMQSIRIENLMVYVDMLNNRLVGVNNVEKN